MKDFDEIKEISKIAYNFFKSFNPVVCKNGRTDLENGVYVNIESYKTQKRCERKFEAHKRYIDIQYMISGRELITKASVNELEISEGYDTDKDIVFYYNCLKGQDFLLEPGTFLILRPGEAHMPCICVDGEQQVRKAVLKVPIL